MILRFGWGPAPKEKIKLKNKPSNLISITYESADKSIATVSKKGYVTAKKAGKTTVTVTVKYKNEKGKTAKTKLVCDVNVYNRGACAYAKEWSYQTYTADDIEDLDAYNYYINKYDKESIEPKLWAEYEQACFGRIHEYGKNTEPDINKFFNTSEEIEEYILSSHTYCSYGLFAVTDLNILHSAGWYTDWLRSKGCLASINELTLACTKFNDTEYIEVYITYEEPDDYRDHYDMYKYIDDEERAFGYIDDILDSLNLEGKSDVEKLEAIFDYIAYGPSRYGDEIGMESLCSHGIFMYDQAVCVGIAKAFYLLSNRIGIRCELVSSSNIAHTWNIVQLDGHWYHVDPTWGRYYFLVSDRQIVELDGTVDMTRKRIEGTEKGYYPVCDQDFYYFGKENYKWWIRNRRGIEVDF